MRVCVCLLTSRANLASALFLPELKINLPPPSLGRVSGYMDAVECQQMNICCAALLRACLGKGAKVERLYLLSAGRPPSLLYERWKRGGASTEEEGGRGGRQVAAWILLSWAPKFNDNKTLGYSHSSFPAFLAPIFFFPRKMKTCFFFLLRGGGC